MLDTRARTRPHMSGALIAWALLLVIALTWGAVLSHTRHDMVVGAAPFFGGFDPHPSARLIPLIVFAAIIVSTGPGLARRLAWRTLLLAVAFMTTAWAVLLAFADGANSLTFPLSNGRNDYLATARSITSLPMFLRGFVAHIGTYNQHTMGHPPGMVTLEWLLLRAGLANTAFNTILTIGGGVAASIAALVALREVAGENRARAAAPFLILVPAAVWWSSADAFYAGVSAWSVALVMLATGREGRRADAFALIGGLGFGATAYLSYGLAPLVLIPIVVAYTRRRLRPLAIAMIGPVAAFVMFAAAGFSWFAGLAATRRQYAIGVARWRPYPYFLVGNLAVFAVATGPAVAIALARLRDRASWCLVGSMLGVIAAADIAGLSKAEVERIWLPFVPWVVVSTAAFAGDDDLFVRRTLALQAACGAVVAVALWSIW
jgi:hypothetical protein